MSIFLTAEWRDLVVINFEVAPSILLPLVPAGTELDLWEGSALVSLVAFRFLNTKVRGLSVPFHVNFEEANLRFYVKRPIAGELRRGVVFVKELVPRPAIALTARLLFGEPYQYVPMSSDIRDEAGERHMTYRWSVRGSQSLVSAVTKGEPEPLSVGSESEFILEHYWGYTRRSSTRTSEYRVEHPRWRHWKSPRVELQVDVASTYGEPWARALSRQWRTAFVAEGSGVAVHSGRYFEEG